MMKNPKFDDIRPYYEEEIPAAMHRIAESNLFPVLSAFVFPGKDVEEIRELMMGIKTSEEFQKKVMYQVNVEVMRKFTEGFTVSGTENIPADRKCLYVSNHRDIVLDASLLQNVLIDLGYETSEITFGANLMTHPLVVDIGKSNKMFKVTRGGNPRDFYNNLVHLSEYIRYTILENDRSVWIAQRNGRTKDGNDATDQGIIKMFGISCPDDKIEALASLCIVPVAVSYEWEPCDVLKVLELYESADGVYQKKPGEDLNSIITGMMASKGRVHFHICKPISREELMQYDELTSSVFNRKVAEMIDSRIYAGYRLYPNNFIAHDIRYGQHRHTDKYTQEQKAAFKEHLRLLEKYESYSYDALRDIMLKIYSNPVDNCNNQ